MAPPTTHAMCQVVGQVTVVNRYGTGKEKVRVDFPSGVRRTLPTAHLEILRNPVHGRERLLGGPLHGPWKGDNHDRNFLSPAYNVPDAYARLLERQFDESNLALEDPNALWRLKGKTLDEIKDMILWNKYLRTEGQCWTFWKIKSLGLETANKNRDLDILEDDIKACNQMGCGSADKMRVQPRERWPEEHIRLLKAKAEVASGALVKKYELHRDKKQLKAMKERTLLTAMKERSQDNDSVGIITLTDKSGTFRPVEIQSLENPSGDNSHILSHDRPVNPSVAFCNSQVMNITTEILPLRPCSILQQAFLDSSDEEEDGDELDHIYSHDGPPCGLKVNVTTFTHGYPTPDTSPVRKESAIPEDHKTSRTAATDSSTFSRIDTGQFDSESLDYSDEDYSDEEQEEAETSEEEKQSWLRQYWLNQQVYADTEYNEAYSFIRNSELRPIVPSTPYEAKIINGLLSLEAQTWAQFNNQRAPISEADLCAYGFTWATPSEYDALNILTNLEKYRLRAEGQLFSGFPIQQNPSRRINPCSWTLRPVANNKKLLQKAADESPIPILRVITPEGRICQPIEPTEAEYAQPFKHNAPPKPAAPAQPAQYSAHVEPVQKERYEYSRQWQEPFIQAQPRGILDSCSWILHPLSLENAIRLYESAQRSPIPVIIVSNPDRDHYECEEALPTLFPGAEKRAMERESEQEWMMLRLAGWRRRDEDFQTYYRRMDAEKWWREMAVKDAQEREIEMEMEMEEKAEMERQAKARSDIERHKLASDARESAFVASIDRLQRVVDRENEQRRRDIMRAYVLPGFETIEEESEDET